MSKITNDGVTRSGTGRFIPYGNSGRQRVNQQSQVGKVQKTNRQTNGLVITSSNENKTKLLLKHTECVYKKAPLFV